MAGYIGGLKMDFIHHTDGAHGWIEADKSLLSDLGIADKITSYSYQRGDKVYLEEDCDLNTLIKALNAKNINYTLFELYRDESPIRNYDRYSRA